MKRRGLVRGGLVLPTLALAACGFHPVYARGGQTLPAIDVDLLPERDGQLMRQALQARLPAPGRTSARYGLQVTFAIVGDTEGVLADSTATRVRLRGSASYALIDRDSGLVVQRGAARAYDGVDLVNQQLLALDLASERARARLADTIAGQIVTQIAARLG